MTLNINNTINEFPKQNYSTDKRENNITNPIEHPKEVAEEEKPFGKESTFNPIEEDLSKKELETKEYPNNEPGEDDDNNKQNGKNKKSDNLEISLD